jgi:phage FluMu protein gp41
VAQITFPLIDGLRLGDIVLKNVTMRDAVAGDIIEAQEESERPVMTSEGWQLIASPAILAVNVMRRQIVSIDDNKGPISLAEIKKLSATDLSLLQEKCDELDEAVANKLASRAVTRRGRTEPDGAGNHQNDQTSE